MYLEKRNLCQLPENAQFNRFSSRDNSGTLKKMKKKLLFRSSNTTYNIAIVGSEAQVK